MRRQVLHVTHLVFFLTRSLLQYYMKISSSRYETIESDFVFTDASIRKEKTSSPSSRKQRPLFVNVELVCQVRPLHWSIKHVILLPCFIRSIWDAYLANDVKSVSKIMLQTIIDKTNILSIFYQYLHLIETVFDNLWCYLTDCFDENNLRYKFSI